MNILITGSTGLIGSALIPLLTTNGHTITRLTRSKSGLSEFKETALYWNPKEKKIDASGLEGQDAVIHLAGENIAGRWNEEKKK
jgi:Predicted nucleoside-diphosphate sugar epimerase